MCRHTPWFVPSTSFMWPIQVAYAGWVVGMTRWKRLYWCRTFIYKKSCRQGTKQSATALNNVHTTCNISMSAPCQCLKPTPFLNSQLCHSPKYYKYLTHALLTIMILGFAPCLCNHQLTACFIPILFGVSAQLSMLRILLFCKACIMCTVFWTGVKILHPPLRPHSQSAWKYASNQNVYRR